MFNGYAGEVENILTHCLVLPVDAVAAPIRIVGIPNKIKTKAAAKQVIFALAVEVVDSVLWWKH